MRAWVGTHSIFDFAWARLAPAVTNENARQLWRTSKNEQHDRIEPIFVLKKKMRFGNFIVV